jgi:N-acylglucosamine 2-epimerase
VNLPALAAQYRTLLADGIIPFWLRHGADRQFGGVLSCMNESGAVQSTDKYTWSQARFVWTLSALYNRFEPRQEFLDLARLTIHFLLRHARLPNGRFAYRTSRDGRPLEGATSIYSDCFVVYGLSEFCRATGDAALLATAREILHAVRIRVEEEDFSETAPYALPPGRRCHGIPMILTEVTGSLAETTADPALEAAALTYARTILDRFLLPDRHLLFEFVTRDYQPLPPPEGTFVMPGHAIESMWFILHRAMRAGDQALIRRATECLRWHLEAAWDPEFGGLFLSLDSDGHPPFQPNSEKKIWWPHTEALYATLLAHRLTGQNWCEEWYQRVHEWAFAHFPMPCGEWWQRLDRQGRQVEDLIALPVKDPFHLPRAVIFILQLLGC